MIAVIIAAGQGTRLWPLSRKNKPKQFREIISNNPMIVDTYNRMAKTFAPDEIFIATVEEFIPTIQKSLPDFPRDQFIIEPYKRDTGPAMLNAIFELQNRGLGDTAMVFIPTDHYIQNEDRFLQTVAVAEEIIHETGKMMGVSVQPDFPSTILGYTRIGEVERTVDGIEVYEFKGHVEKPDLETAKRYVQAGDYLWHANYYMWTPNKFMEAYKTLAPEMYLQIEKMRANPDQKDEYYSAMPAISFDYAIAEKIAHDQVLFIKGDFGWSDIGAWDVLHHQRTKEHDQNGNFLKGQIRILDTKNSYITGSSGKMVAVIGLDDVVVVDTPDALLVCAKEKAQDVKKIVSQLSDEGLTEYL